MCSNCKYGIELGENIGETTIDENWCNKAYGEGWKTEDNGGGYWVVGCDAYEPINTAILYRAWMSSKEWADMRRKFIEDAGYKCNLCRSAINLCVHHINYEHLCMEDEHPEDVIVVCRNCHEKLHEVDKNGMDQR
jgi:hypothetical protein